MTDQAATKTKPEATPAMVAAGIEACDGQLHAASIRKVWAAMQAATDGAARAPASAEIAELLERADEYLSTIVNKGNCGPHHLVSDMAAAMRGAAQLSPKQCKCLGGSTYNDGTVRRCDLCGLPVPLTDAPAQPSAYLRPGLIKAAEIVDNMRISEAGLFDAEHSGARGEARSNGLYDACMAIKAVTPAVQR